MAPIKLKMDYLLPVLLLLQTQLRCPFPLSYWAFSWMTPFSSFPRGCGLTLTCFSYLISRLSSPLTYLGCPKAEKLSFISTRPEPSPAPGRESVLRGSESGHSLPTKTEMRWLGEAISGFSKSTPPVARGCSGPACPSSHFSSQRLTRSTATHPGLRGRGREGAGTARPRAGRSPAPFVPGSAPAGPGQAPGQLGPNGTRKDPGGRCRWQRPAPGAGIRDLRRPHGTQVPGWGPSQDRGRRGRESARPARVPRRPARREGRGRRARGRADAAGRGRRGHRKRWEARAVPGCPARRGLGPLPPSRWREAERGRPLAGRARVASA